MLQVLRARNSQGSVVVAYAVAAAALAFGLISMLQATGATMIDHLNRAQLTINN